MPEPLYRRSYDADTLLRQHPPKFHHPHKAALFEMAYPAGESATGRVEVTRWSRHVPAILPVPEELPTGIRPDFFDYAAVGDPARTVEWHVNFADPALFVAYGSRLFAQDELQVAEHPLLACVREALLAEGLPAKTVDETGATPVLVRDVERRLEVSTDVNSAAGRPAGLYGNQFAASPLDAVRRATRKIRPSTSSNIIAMAAPSGGRGEYTAREITSVFSTAYTAFSAALQESAAGDAGRRVVIHSGFWGCGAFGGNRRLMVALQALAARAAGVGLLVMHSGNRNGAEEMARGLEVADMLAFRCGPACPLDRIVERTAMLGYRWGAGDGN